MIKPEWIKPEQFQEGDLVFIASNCDTYLILEITDTSFVMKRYHYGIEVDRIVKSKEFFSPISFMVAREYEEKNSL
jgi:hypothetical protein